MKTIGHMSIQGEVSGSFKKYDDYPTNPELGTWAYIRGSLMMCNSVDGLPLWIPLSQERNTHVHDQKVAANKWSVPHVLGTSTVITQCFDENGGVLIPSSITNIDEDTTEIYFPDAIKGKAILIYGMESGVSAQGKINVIESIPVDGVHFTMSNRKPYDDLGYGEWALITGDASLAFGDGNACSGESVGSNEKTVPLPKHTHTYSRITSFQSATNNANWGTVDIPKVGWSAYNGTGNSSGTRVAMRIQNASDTSSEAGTANAKVNVQGAVIKLNVWRRTA